MTDLVDNSKYNINENIVTHNLTDEEGNPTGGFVQLVVKKDGEDHMAFNINWQDGPRGSKDLNKDGSPVALMPPNGAFIEDVIWSAIQRLEFFQASKFECEENAQAISSLEEALKVLESRTKERSARKVEGKHEV